jgi:aminoglycoside/choline kinase family phosphotransferase
LKKNNRDGLKSPMRLEKEVLLDFIRRSVSRRVVDLGVEKLGGDASDRDYYRLHLGGGDAPLPQTLVVMELQTPFLAEELPFINILHTLERSGIGVPKLYGVEPHWGIVLLEDLGDEILQKKIEQEKPHRIEGLYREALEMIVAMQCGIRASSDCVAFQTAFTVERFRWELDFFRLHYIERLLGKTIHPGDRKSLDQLFLWLSSLLDQEKKVFTHRDYHSRNLIVHDGRLKVLDFQDARMGPVQYDVASLLRDSYVVLGESRMDALLGYYITRLEERTGQKIDRGRFRYLFDMTCLQRNLKAIGTFGYQAVERGNDRYLRYIPDTLTYVAKNLDRYDELKPYRETFARYMPLDEQEGYSALCL